ncbi:MAG TPA: acylphosphatase [Acidimicrobiales bacterium]|nr:acylphosphatase [Acidimicrobiales bacterium]
MRARRRVLVDGRVQGVFFRDTCRREAVAAQLDGWVRNLPDGRVEAVFEGEAEAVQRLVDWCAVGPPRATVARVEVHVEEPRGERGFRVG